MNTYVCSIYDFEFLQVSFARPSSESIKFSNIYISNLPQTISQEELENLFADFGYIISSKILPCPKAGRQSDLHVDELNQIIDFKIQQNI